MRVAGLELDKSTRAASRAGLPSGPSPELVAERLRVLREFRSSSYPGYAGYEAPLTWVWREPLARLCAGNNPDEQAAALRAYTESAVLEGTMEPPWSRVLDGIALGSATFGQRLRREARGNPREQKALRGAPDVAA